MKKSLLSVILLFVVLFASAQENASDANKFYIKGGLSVKGVNFVGANDAKDVNFHDEYWDGYSIKGGNFELGSIFYIDKLNLGNKFGVGIDVNYLTSNYMIQTNDDNLNVDEKYQYFTVGSAIGPIFTYYANNTIAFDVYFKANPIWFSGALYKYEYTQSNTEKNGGYLGFEGMKYKMGINIRIDYFEVSAEFNPGYSILKNYNAADEYLGNAGEMDNHLNEDINSLGDLVDLMTNVGFSQKTPLPVFNFSIGFCF